MAKREFSSEGDTIRLADGRNLGYTEVGDPDGAPLFFFHGAPGSRLEGLTYHERSRDLGVRLIAPERPGYGLSDVHRKRSYLDWAKDIGQLADHLGADRFRVLGVSSGGPYAWAVAHELPARVTVACAVSGEGPYASDDYPESVMKGDAFNGSGFNKFMILLAKVPVLMQGLWSVIRVPILRDPVGFLESLADEDAPEHDKEYFAGEHMGPDLAEAFRQGATGAAQDHAIERRRWPFELEGVRVPALVFHGERDVTVDPEVSRYVAGRLPMCDEPTIFPGEGHSVLHYEFETIVSAMLADEG